jgi:DNA-binding NtrC family response regulator
MRRPGFGMLPPDTLGTDLNIEDVRTDEEIRTKWAKHVVAMCQGNKKLAAKVLNISRSCLDVRLKNAVSR